MRRRSGFTLVELMVAMALTLFIMAILSQAFIAGIDTFVGLKGIGDMQENLRVAANALRADLSQDHLEGKRRLSDTYDPNHKPYAGFFALAQSSPRNTSVAPPYQPYQIEGTDADGLDSARAVDHQLHFAVKLKGNRRESFFRAALRNPAGTLGAQTFLNTLKTHYYLDANGMGDATMRDGGLVYHSPWAEVAYFLERTGSTEEPENPTSTLGTPLFALKRAQLAVVPDDSDVDNKYAFNDNTVAPPFNEAYPGHHISDTFVDVSSIGSGTRVNFLTPADLATGTRALGTGRPFNKALVLPNVISFQVQTMIKGQDNTPSSTNPPAANLPLAYQSSYFEDIRTYDSKNGIATIEIPSRAPTLRTMENVSLQALQVRMRVWDPKTRQTRQLTFIQDL